MPLCARRVSRIGERVLLIPHQSCKRGVELAEAAVEGGADFVELGFPFSDPLADGPVVRRAAEKALALWAEQPPFKDNANLLFGSARLTYYVLPVTSPVWLSLSGGGSYVRRGGDAFEGLNLFALDIDGE